MLSQTHWPRTELGLAIPPEELSTEEVDKIKAPESRRFLVSRHHLYWPREDYLPDPLKKKFRDHKFNSVWLPDPQHIDIHGHFVGASAPPVDIMLAFLDEANLLLSLGVSVQAIEMIDEALYEDQVLQIHKTEENRERHLRLLGNTVATRFEIVPSATVQVLVSRAVELLAA